MPQLPAERQTSIVGLQYVAVTGVTEEDTGIASGVQRAADQMGGAAGVAVCVGVGFAPTLHAFDPYLVDTLLAGAGLVTGAIVARRMPASAPTPAPASALSPAPEADQREQAGLAPAGPRHLGTRGGAARRGRGRQGRQGSKARRALRRAPSGSPGFTRLHPAEWSRPTAGVVRPRHASVPWWCAEP